MRWASMALPRQGGTGWVMSLGPSSPIDGSSALGGSGWRGVFALRAEVPVSLGKVTC